MPPNVRRFLVNAVPSIPFLEAALLLRAETQEKWTGQRLAARLYISERRAQALLIALADAGLARTDSQRKFWCTEDPVTGALLDEVADFYAHNLLATTTLVHLNTDQGARRFADAFTLKKD